VRLFQRQWWFTGLIIGLVLLGVVDVLDTAGVESVDAAFKRALLGFALARGLNGVISVAQGTEFSIAPAGVGVNLSTGCTKGTAFSQWLVWVFRVTGVVWCAADSTKMVTGPFQSVIGTASGAAVTCFVSGVCYRVVTPVCDATGGIG